MPEYINHPGTVDSVILFDRAEPGEGLAILCGREVASGDAVLLQAMAAIRWKSELEMAMERLADAVQTLADAFLPAIESALKPAIEYLSEIGTKFNAIGIETEDAAC